VNIKTPQFLTSSFKILRKNKDSSEKFVENQTG
jgi:hypothetical protein